LARASRQPY